VREQTSLDLLSRRTSPELTRSSTASDRLHSLPFRSSSGEAITDVPAFAEPDAQSPENGRERELLGDGRCGRVERNQEQTMSFCGTGGLKTVALISAGPRW
jgi:hypothetical protein